jgi:hypothetical protein
MGTIGLSQHEAKNRVAQTFTNAKLKKNLMAMANKINFSGCRRFYKNNKRAVFLKEKVLEVSPLVLVNSQIMEGEFALTPTSLCGLRKGSMELRPPTPNSKSTCNGYMRHTKHKTPKDGRPFRAATPAKPQPIQEDFFSVKMIPLLVNNI